MLRSRLIKPGVATNEKLAALGADGMLLFERLWMLADREGRLEDRPERIKAEAFPYWREFPVEKLLKKLSKEGFIHRYVVDHFRLIFIPNFKKHQPIHKHEAASVLPAPPADLVSSRNGYGSEFDAPDHVETCSDMSRNVDPHFTSTFTSTSGGDARARGQISTRRISPPPKKPAARERNAEGGPREGPPKTRSPVNFWPHTEESVNAIRCSLAALAREVHMPVPDDDIVKQVLDAGRGATGDEIHSTIRSLFFRQKFREMHSWGLVPIVVAGWFSHAGAA
jgi:hypothetical protein